MRGTAAAVRPGRRVVGVEGTSPAALGLLPAVPAVPPDLLRQQVVGSLCVQVRYIDLAGKVCVTCGGVLRFDGDVWDQQSRPLVRCAGGHEFPKYVVLSKFHRGRQE